jgi:hypothetical protein
LVTAFRHSDEFRLPLSQIYSILYAKVKSPFVHQLGLMSGCGTHPVFAAREFRQYLGMPKAINQMVLDYEGTLR